ncbi:hypothetical protein DFS33DRAFT_1389637 [Desarmillaria ectypa]|nr:hypothetical protein DFS33DRAFT_1389637 [Desarmillaria ectypa]
MGGRRFDIAGLELTTEHSNKDSRKRFCSHVTLEFGERYVGLQPWKGVIQEVKGRSKEQDIFLAEFVCETYWKTNDEMKKRRAITGGSRKLNVISTRKAVFRAGLACMAVALASVCFPVALRGMVGSARGPWIKRHDRLAIDVINQKRDCIGGKTRILWVV